MGPPSAIDTLVGSVRAVCHGASVTCRLHFKQTVSSNWMEARGRRRCRSEVAASGTRPVAGDAAAERQALIDLAAVCIVLAARIPGHSGEARAAASQPTFTPRRTPHRALAMVCIIRAR